MKKHPPVPSRDDATLVERVRSLRAHGWNVRETGEVCEMPLLAAERSPGGDHPQVLLVGGIHDAAPAAMIGASNPFEVAIATAVMLFGLSSGAALTGS